MFQLFFMERLKINLVIRLPKQRSILECAFIMVMNPALNMGKPRLMPMDYLPFQDIKVKAWELA